MKVIISFLLFLYVSYFDVFTLSAEEGSNSKLNDKSTVVDKSKISGPKADELSVNVKSGQSIEITLTGSGFSVFDPPTSPLHGRIVPVGDCGGSGVDSYSSNIKFSGSDSFTYTAGDFSSTGKLVYTPNKGFTGTDSFTYTVRNGAVVSNVATVTVTVEGLVLNYALNDSKGSGVLVDSSKAKRNMSLRSIDSSYYSLDGESLTVTDDLFRLSTSDLGLFTNSLTIAAWIKPIPKEIIDTYTAILMTRTDGDGNGLTFYKECVGFSWNGNSSIYNWNSKLKLVKGQWQFVALVIAPEGGTVFQGLAKDKELRLKSYKSVLAKQLLNYMQLGGEFRISSSDRTRTFIGSLKDVRMWNYSMSNEQVEALFDAEKGNVP